MSETPAPAPGRRSTRRRTSSSSTSSATPRSSSARWACSRTSRSASRSSRSSRAASPRTTSPSSGAGPSPSPGAGCIVGTFTTLVALSMAEIASTYPTAGGLYYWSSKLGSAGWGWFTGWFNLIGLIGIVAAVGLRPRDLRDVAAQPALGLPERHPPHLLRLRRRDARGTLLNVFDVRITSTINGISAWWHVIGVVIIVGALIIVPDNHQSVSYVFTTTVNNSGFSGHGLEQHRLLDGLRDRADDVAVHADRVRRVGAHGRGDAQGLALRRRRHDLGSHPLGDRRVHPPPRADVRDPGRDRRVQEQFALHRDLHLAGVDEQDLGRVPALHRRRGAVLLPHRLPDLRLADAVRVLA